MREAAVVVPPEQARENREYVRKLLEEKQPEFAAALESVIRELSAAGCLAGAAIAMGDGGSPDGAPLFLGGASPDARGVPLAERPGQARRLHRAGAADPLGLIDLAQ